MKKILFVILFMFFGATANAQFLSGASCVVAASDSLSASVDLAGRELIAIETPAALTSSTIIFYTSADTATANYKQVYKEGTAVSVGIGVDRYIIMDGTKNLFHRYVKIETDSPEAAERTFKFYYR